MPGSSNSGAQAYLERVSAFAHRDLNPDAEAMDTDSRLIEARYETFQTLGLNVGWAPQQPLSPREFCEVLATLSRRSGAFAFVALQQIVANGSLGALAGRIDTAGAMALWPRIGVAFGHLRNPDGPAPVLVNGRASGPVPWLTGAGVFDKIVLGLRTPAGDEVLALVDGHHRTALRHSEPLPLAACSGTRTVHVGRL